MNFQTARDLMNAHTLTELKAMLKEDEIKEVEANIRLGDSEKLAIATTIFYRKDDNTDFYRQAYYS